MYYVQLLFWTRFFFTTKWMRGITIGFKVRGYTLESPDLLVRELIYYCIYYIILISVIFNKIWAPSEIIRACLFSRKDSYWLNKWIWPYNWLTATATGCELLTHEKYHFRDDIDIVSLDIWYNRPIRAIFE